jgi:hypothetical protein
MGFRESFELIGRSPEYLHEQMKLRNANLVPVPDALARLKLAVYYVENSEHEPEKLRLTHWE